MDCFDYAEVISNWKHIKGFGVRYEVSDRGEVRSWLKKGHWNNQESSTAHLVKPCVRKDGYISVVLTKPEANARSYLVHRLVAEVFISSIPQNMHVAHLDGDKANNKLSNIAIVTPQENEKHKIIHGTNRRGTFEKGSKVLWSKITEADVLNIRKLYNEGALQNDLAKKFGIAQTGVSSIVRRKTWRHI